jgi:methylenetetrahydrofolate reductase (NADPH)
MPIFTPGRRWQPPFSPFKSISAGTKILVALEKIVKGPLFGCRMCGNCMLQETAFICPMECSKGARNGPCGGSTAEHCYVDPGRPCIWYHIYDRSFRMGREAKLLEVLPPMDWYKTGSETWGDVIREVRRYGTGKWIRELLSRDARTRAVAWDDVFRAVAQPEWWQGDAKFHAPAYEEPVSDLEKQLKDGKFVVTCEVSPPLTAATGKFIRNLELVKGMVTAVNFTDNPSATPRMSSQACSKLALEQGIEPVMQMAARDQTRNSLQSLALGAHALGIRNLLCVSGDSASLGPDPRARMDVLDIDSIQMLWILRRMRDEGQYLGGKSIKFPPQYFLGAAASPNASEPKFQALREEKKINAGAQFLQTNLVFDMNRFDAWLEALDKRNVLGKAYILVGVAPLKNKAVVQHLQNDVPGVTLPKAIVERMENTKDEGEEGVQIALEIIEHVRHCKGINGIHLMPLNWEEIIPRVIKDAGLA